MKSCGQFVHFAKASNLVFIWAPAKELSIPKKAYQYASKDARIRCIFFLFLSTNLTARSNCPFFS